MIKKHAILHTVAIYGNILHLSITKIQEIKLNFSVNVIKQFWAIKLHFSYIPATHDCNILCETSNACAAA